MFDHFQPDPPEENIPKDEARAYCRNITEVILAACANFIPTAVKDKVIDHCTIDVSVSICFVIHDHLHMSTMYLTKIIPYPSNVYTFQIVSDNFLFFFINYKNCNLKINVWVLAPVIKLISTNLIG